MDLVPKRQEETTKGLTCDIYGIWNLLRCRHDWIPGWILAGAFDGYSPAGKRARVLGSRTGRRRLALVKLFQKTPER